MYLQRRGARVLLLHSYRDGTGAVRRRRFGHIEGRDGLLEALKNWDGWRAGVSRQYREIRFDWERLRQQAETIALDPGWRHVRARQPAEVTPVQVRRTLRRLLQQLDHEPQMLEEALRELEARRVPEGSPDNETEIEDCLQQGDWESAEHGCRNILREARKKLAPRRRRFDSEDRQAGAYLRALETTARVLEAQGRLEESALVAGDRARGCPNKAGLMLYGAALQRAGRNDEAVTQYSRVPARDAWRSYNLACAHYQQGERDSALVAFLQGLNHQGEIGRVLPVVVRGETPFVHGEYWAAYGQLWSAETRQFFHAVYEQKAVRRRLFWAKYDGAIAREMLAPQARRKILEDVKQQLSQPPAEQKRFPPELRRYEKWVKPKPAARVLEGAPSAPA